MNGFRLDIVCETLWTDCCLLCCLYSLVFLRSCLKSVVSCELKWRAEPAARIRCRSCRRNTQQISSKGQGNVSKSVVSEPVAMTAVQKPMENIEKELIIEHELETIAVEPTVSTSSWFSWLWKAPQQQPKFTKLANIEYPSLTGVQSEKNKLDIYLPKESSNAPEGARKLPVLIHIHGGGWVRGTPRTIPFSGFFWIISSEILSD